MKEFGVYIIEDMMKVLEDDELCAAYFSEHDVYMSLRGLQSILNDMSTSSIFSQNIKKMYDIEKFETLGSNKPYFKCTFVKGRLKIINKK